MGALVSREVDVGASLEAALVILERRQEKCLSALLISCNCMYPSEQLRCQQRAVAKARGLIQLCRAWDGCPMEPRGGSGLDPQKALDAYLHALWVLDAVKVSLPQAEQKGIERSGLEIMPRVVSVAQRLHGPASPEAAELLLSYAGRILSYPGALKNGLALARRLAEEALRILRECKRAPCPEVERALKSPYERARHLCSTAAPAVRFHRDAVSMGWGGAAALRTGLSTHLDALRTLAILASLSPASNAMFIGADRSALPAAQAHLAALEAAHGAASPHCWDGHVSMMFAAWKFGEGEAAPALEWGARALEALQRTGAAHVGAAEVLELTAEVHLQGLGNDVAGARRAAERALAVRKQVGADLQPNRELQAFIAQAQAPRAQGRDAGRPALFSLRFGLNVVGLPSSCE